MRNQLGVPLEIPSVPWRETNQKYAQKTVQNLDLAQETMKVPQLPKKCSKLFEMGIKMDTSWCSQNSQNEEKLGMMPQVPYNFQTNFLNGYVPKWTTWGMCKKLY